ncbi:MAG: lipoate--protein ligase [bacterium]
MILIENNECTDPFVNLAIEEYVFRNFDVSEGYLFLYINQRSIIIGRNQNPFEEINPEFIYNNDFPIARRISGGGTVYHDFGNLSFSFIREFESNLFNKYREFTQPIIDLLTELGVVCNLDERNNIRIIGKKISGNAQFTSRKKMISHGTLLFDSDLTKLNTVLKCTSESLVSKSTPSIKSEVVNITNYLLTKLDIQEFKVELISKILGNKNPEQLIFSSEQWNEINKLADTKYRTWEWTYGETPPFSYSRKIYIGKREINIDIEIVDGMITSMKPSQEFNLLDESIILNSFIGCKFRESEILSVFEEYGRGIPSTIEHEAILKIFDLLPGIRKIISNL